MPLKHTHTLATLGVSPGTYDEIEGKLRDAEQFHRFFDGIIDMAGVGLVKEEEAFRFAPVTKGDGAKDASKDERMAILAVCVAHQQRAGFGTYLDLREVPCDYCGAPGFNTGLGFWQHSCGLETADGDVTTPCGNKPAAAG